MPANNDNRFMDMIRLAKVLQRELKGETLASLERKLKIPKTLISEWKQGRLPAGKSLSHLKTLSLYLGLSIEELLFDKNVSDKKTLSSTTFHHNGNTYKINIEVISSEIRKSK